MIGDERKMLAVPASVCASHVSQGGGGVHTFVTLLITVMSRLSGVSYAAAAAATITGGKKVKFVYTEEVPSKVSTITRPAIALVVNQKLYKTVPDAQQQFSHNDPELKKLDTSGDLDNYVVSSADGTTVNFHHENNLQTVINICVLFLSYIKLTLI